MSLGRWCLLGLALGVMLGCAHAPLEVGERRSPKSAPGAKLAAVVELAAGERHTCALRGDGEVRCWGSNAFGQLGARGKGALAWSPVPVEGVTDGAQIAAASGLTCVRTRDGRVRCWGQAVKSQSFVATAPLEGVTDAAEIAVGFRQLCVRRRGGAVACRRTSADVFHEIEGIARAEQIAAGWGHACALDASGAVLCWGSNGKGELGNGTFSDSSTPVRVHGLYRVVQIHASRRRTCAFGGDGGVRCWGDLSLDDPESEPIRVPRTGGLAGFAASTSRACGFFADHHVECLEAAELWPSHVRLAVDPIVQIVAGYGHFCALEQRGGVLCWGQNDDGQLADPDTASASPREVPGIHDAATVHVFANKACAVRRSGAVSCWGALADARDRTEVVRPRDAALTDGEGAPRSRSPSNDAKVSRATSREASRTARLIELHAAPEDEDVYAMVFPGRIPPLEAPGEAFEHSCNRREDGTAECRGANDYGQLGQGAPGPPRAAPLPVAGVAGVAEIAVGDRDTCAVLVSGAVWCWGADDEGQLGDGVRHGRNDEPRRVEGLTP